MSDPAPRVLIVRFSSIGDLLLTTPLLRAIRHRHREAEITFVTRADMADILCSNPHLSHVIAWERGSSLLELARQLRREPWTHRLDLHGSLRSLLLRRLVGGHWGSYPKYRQRRRALIRSHGTSGDMLGPVADRYFVAAAELDVVPDGGPAEFVVPEPARQQARALLQLAGIDGRRSVVALAPGAAHFTKRWPVKHWIALAAELAHEHDLVILGGNDERAAAAAIAAAVRSRVLNAAGEVRLDGTAALLQAVSQVIVGDTGVLHLATAVGTPVVGIYGPTVAEFGFFPYHALAIAVQHSLPCRPCSSQGGPVCPLGHHHCLVQILPAEVVAASALLAPAPSRLLNG